MPGPGICPEEKWHGVYAVRRRGPNKGYITAVRAAREVSVRHRVVCNMECAGMHTVQSERAQHAAQSHGLWYMSFVTLTHDTVQNEYVKEYGLTRSVQYGVPGDISIEECTGLVSQHDVKRLIAKYLSPPLTSMCLTAQPPPSPY